MADNQINPYECMAKLNNHCQKNSLQLEYRDIYIAASSQDHVFTVAVVIDKVQYESATGKTKKEAKALAAVLAWNTIQEQKKGELHLCEQHKEPKLSLLSPSVPELPSSNPINYVSWLSEYASKNNVQVQYKMISKTGPQHEPVFSYVCQIGGKVFDVGSGNKLKAAKNKAAKLAYESLTRSSTFRAEECTNPVSDSSCMTFSSSQGLSSEASGSTTDLDLELEKTSDSITQHADAIQLNKSSSSQSSGEECTNSMSDSSDMTFSSSQGVSSEASGSTTDLDLELEKTSDRITQHADAIQLNKISSSQNSVSPPSQSMKPKRKETPLTARVSNLCTRTSKFTKNDRFLEDFDDIEEIGSGGFGNVFKAKNIIDCRICAIKRILSGKTDDGTREVIALGQLDHQHIVQYYNCWSGEDIFQFPDTSNSSSEICMCLFIQMEFCEKGNLSDWLYQKDSCKDVSMILFQQIVEGVEYIHSKNLIHRDLKPLNIFFHSENHIKIGDFGLVSLGLTDGQRTSNKGTKNYMAPEQVGSNYDKKVDIFPLGLILYEMLSPFLTRCEKYQEWPNIKEGKLPKTFTKKFTKETSLIMKLLSKEPAQRPSAAHILEILKDQPHTLRTY